MDTKLMEPIKGHGEHTCKHGRSTALCAAKHMYPREKARLSPVAKDFWAEMGKTPCTNHTR